MIPPGLPSDEEARTQALREYRILDTEPEEAFQDLIELTAQILEVPIVLVSLVDTERQWFKACFGLDVRETPRAISFCGHVIESRGPIEVADARLDPRFHDNPLVVGEPRIRFYAGQPLCTPGGHFLGTLCAIDRVPRVLSERQRQAQRRLAAQIVALLELRKKTRELEEEKRSLEQKDASLSAQESRLQALFVAMEEGVVVHDRQGRIVRSNPAAERILGLTFEQMEGRDPMDPRWFACRPDGSPFPGEEHPSSICLATGRPVDDVIMGIHRPSGELSWLLVNAHPIQGAGGPGADAVVATFHDITSQVNAEDSRRARLLDAILSNLPGASLAIFDQDLCIRERFGDHVAPGLSPGVGDRLSGWVTGDPRAELEGAAARCLQGEPARLDVNGKDLRVELRLVPLAGEGWGARGLALAYDVSEREQLRERVGRHERLATVGTLAAGVGHEINNPLTFIVSNLDYIVEELKTSEGGALPRHFQELVEAATEAQEGAERIREIVRGLRALAIEDSAPCPTALHAAIDIAVRMARHEIRHKASLELRLDPVPRVMGDETRLSQVLLNLLINAAQAFKTSDPSRNRILVQTRRTSSGQVEVQVVDNGPGVSPDALPRIFDPFFTTKPVGQGTGLGLAISRTIVQSFGGEISCETEVDRGATFRVTLLAAGPDLEHDAEQAAVKRAGRVLVIDDEPAVLKAIVRMLRQDYDVVALSDPRDALRSFEEGERFDVVLCDLMMPHMSGLELLGQLRGGLAPGPRFVVMSGGVVKEETRRALAELPIAFLEKPFSSAELRQIVKRLTAPGEEPTRRSPAP